MPGAFPFAAFVGHEQAKRSLICHAIDPHLGGTLLYGSEGCGKTILALGLAELMPDGAPFLHMPWHTTIERLTGGPMINLPPHEQIPEHEGLMTLAHNGVLFMDDVHLHPEHLLQHLLDVTSTGVVRTEIDGHSHESECRFAMVATLNHKIGKIGRQLLDRFAHTVWIQPSRSSADRQEISHRCAAFDDDPETFREAWHVKTEALQRLVATCRNRIYELTIPDYAYAEVSARAQQLNEDSQRLDQAVLRTSRCIAALSHATSIGREHIEDAWELCHPKTILPQPKELAQG